MKRKWYVLLALMCALCLAAAGCGSASSAASSSAPGSEPEVVQPDSEPETEPDLGDSLLAQREEPGSGVVASGADTAKAAGDEVEMGEQGKIRIPYTEKQSGVTYIASASELPDYPELKAYDDAYFEDHALVLVTETVSSGSADVGILAVNVQNSLGTVTLYHETPEPGKNGTADMATWLLWAEVEPGLDCRWRVENPAMKSDLVSY